MPSEIIRFGNDLNQITFGDLGEVEQNIFFKLLHRLQKEGLKPVSFTPAEVRNFTGKNLTLKELTQVCRSLRSTLFKKDFTVITEFERDGEELVREDFINLFKHLKVESNRKTGELKTLEVELNEHFEYLLKALGAKFTVMELGEFITLHSKYTKCLFRLLCQFKSTGKRIFAWEEFKRQLAIPDSYKMSDIDKQILKPAIKELSCSDFVRSLETENSQPNFPNLSFKKIKTGRKVTAIEFTWDVKPGERVIDAEPVKDEPQQVQEKTSAPPPAAEKPQQPAPAAASGPQPIERGPASPEVLELMDEAFNLLGKGVKVLR